MSENTNEPNPTSMRVSKIDLNPPKGVPTSCFDPSFAEAGVASRVAMIAYSRISHLPFEQGPLREVTELAMWKRREIEARRITLPAAEEIPGLSRSVRAMSIGEIFRKCNYGNRGHVCYHAQWVTLGIDSRGGYFLDATVGQVFGSTQTEVGLQVRLLSGDEIVAGITWEGSTEPNENINARMLGMDQRIGEWFTSLTGAIIELRADCKGP